MSEASPEEVGIMKHMLGFGARGAKPGWRNYFAAEPDDEQLKGMEAKGLVRRGRAVPGGLVYYHVTREWAEALGAEVSP